MFSLISCAHAGRTNQEASERLVVGLSIDVKGEVTLIDLATGKRVSTKSCDSNCKIFQDPVRVQTLTSITVIKHQDSCCLTFNIDGRLKEWCGLPDSYCRN